MYYRMEATARVKKKQGKPLEIFKVLSLLLLPVGKKRNTILLKKNAIFQRNKYIPTYNINPINYNSLYLSHYVGLYIGFDNWHLVKSVTLAYIGSITSPTFLFLKDNYFLTQNSISSLLDNSWQQTLTLSYYFIITSCHISHDGVWPLLTETPSSVHHHFSDWHHN